VSQAVARGWERAVEFLLRSDEPAIRFLVRRDVLGEDGGEDVSAILSGPKVSALLTGQRPGEFRPGGGWRGLPGAEFGFGVHAYRNWTGAHWRLVSLVELGVPAQEERAHMAAEQVLGWLARPERLREVPVIDGLARRCASQEGNALAVCCRLGLADDERVALLAASLIGWQWPDGGWNCDLRANGRRSSFHESLAPAWGLHEYARATGDPTAQEAAGRAAELFLAHRMFRSLSTGKTISRDWLVPHYPPYWHYDILQGSLIMTRIGFASDPRLSDAVEVLEGLQSEDGTWSAGGVWWKPLGAGRDGGRGLRAWNAEVADWGQSGPNEMITLNVLRLLQAVRGRELGGWLAASGSLAARGLQCC
jgi:hypothetical protein